MPYRVDIPHMLQAIGVFCDERMIKHQLPELKMSEPWQLVVRRDGKVVSDTFLDRLFVGLFGDYIPGLELSVRP